MHYLAKRLAVVIIGALGGFAYYYFIGCADGNTCTITSNPYISTAYGAIIGGIIGFNITPRRNK